jgi:hypothetical protein
MHSEILIQKLELYDRELNKEIDLHISENDFLKKI